MIKIGTLLLFLFCFGWMIKEALDIYNINKIKTQYNIEGLKMNYGEKIFSIFILFIMCIILIGAHFSTYN